mmetsp:Transcript_35440/g.51791  ORF Transcript_35440/g.51791 Transcript_35440/m.51791 type:complete len:92 (+) Transcript_35440:608-883(+)
MDLDATGCYCCARSFQLYFAFYDRKLCCLGYWLKKNRDVTSAGGVDDYDESEWAGVGGAPRKDSSADGSMADEGEEAGGGGGSNQQEKTPH